MITTNFIFEKHSEPYLASMWVNHKLVWGNCARKSCEGIFETGQSWQRTRKLGSNDWLEKFPMIQLTQWPYDKKPCSLPWTIIFTIATCYSVQLNTNFIMPKKASSIWHQFSDKKPHCCHKKMESWVRSQWNVIIVRNGQLLPSQSTQTCGSTSR